MRPKTTGVSGDCDQQDATLMKPSLLDAIRGFGVMSGPSLLLDLFMIGSTTAMAKRLLVRPPRTRAARLPRPLVILGTGLSLIYPLVIRPWMLRWGATDEEARMPLPGDELVPNPAFESTRAVTIHAPVDAVWPWLAQIGQDRGGFYSYEWLEDLAGARIDNADRIHPEWQHRAVGEIVHLHPASGLEVTFFEPNRAVVLKGWGAFVLEPIDAHRTRLLARSRVPGGRGALAYLLLIELPHFIRTPPLYYGTQVAPGDQGTCRTIVSSPAHPSSPLMRHRSRRCGACRRRRSSLCSSIATRILEATRTIRPQAARSSGSTRRMNWVGGR